MIFTLFQFPYHAAFKDDVDEPIYSKDVVEMPAKGTSQNILWKKVQEVNLTNVSDTYAITFAVNSNDWLYCMFRTIGSCRLNTAGKDTDGSTSITGKLPFYGTALYPDIGIISTYNITSMTLEALSAGTTVELFAAVACADNDSRLTTYA